MAVHWEDSRRDSAITHEESQLWTKEYSLATVLHPRPNISIRKTAQEMRNQMLAWGLAAGAITLIAYTIEMWTK